MTVPFLPGTRIKVLYRFSRFESSNGCHEIHINVTKKFHGNNKEESKKGPLNVVLLDRLKEPFLSTYLFFVLERWKSTPLSSFWCRDTDKSLKFPIQVGVSSPQNFRQYLVVYLTPFFKPSCTTMKKCIPTYISGLPKRFDTITIRYC